MRDFPIDLSKGFPTISFETFRPDQALPHEH